MKIKAVILDSSVLINIPVKDLQKRLKSIIKYYVEDDNFVDVYRDVFRLFQRGLLNEEGFFRKLIEQYNLPSRSVKRFIEEHNSSMNSLIKADSSVNEVLTALSTEYKIIVLSGMPKVWFLRYAERLKINTSLINDVVFTSDVNVLKDDVSIFRKACSVAGQKVDRCVYVTNHESEVLTAKEADLSTIGVNLSSADVNLSKLSELSGLLLDGDVLPKQRHEIINP